MISHALAAPTAQAVVDLFAGEWSTRFPPATGINSRGHAGLFEDERIDWALHRFAENGLSIEAARVFEAGPLEAGHTTMLERRGAARITAIESNPRAFLKCLVVKEVMHLSRSRFLHGDVIAYLQNTDESYDLGLASGILYHLVRPVALLACLAPRCRGLYLWTHVYDPAWCELHPEAAQRFGPVEVVTTGGYSHRLYPYHYGESTTWAGFCGGSLPYACWMEQNELLAALRHFGFSRLATRQEDNPNGPALSIVASRG